MTTPLSKASSAKIGTCPHGLPQGACPICSGMGGGSVKKDNKPREMTYNECLAVWQMMKAQKAARKQTLALFAAQSQAGYLSRLQEQINQMKSMLLNSSLPKPVAKAAAALADFVVLPLLGVLQTISTFPRNILSFGAKFFSGISQKLIDIAEKLTALFGEAKASLQRKIDEKFKNLKKKIFDLFGIAFVENEENEEEERIEETKRLFELNTAKEALFEVLNNPTNENLSNERE